MGGRVLTSAFPLLRTGLNHLPASAPLCNGGREALEEIAGQGMTQPPRYCHWPLADVAYVLRRAEEHKGSLLNAKTRKEENMAPLGHVKPISSTCGTIGSCGGLALPVNQLAVDRVIAIPCRRGELP